MENTRFLAIGVTPIDKAGVTTVDPNRFDVADIVASCDVVLGKPGYGTIADCVSGETPLVYALPSGFAEASALDEELRIWGRGVPIDRETLFFGELRPSLDQAVASVARKTYPKDGATIIVGELVETHAGQ